jgi:hypothetical protein
VPEQPDDDKPGAAAPSDAPPVSQGAAPPASVGAGPVSAGTQLTQAELARRVDALAKDEDESERIARVEEQRLQERRAQQKRAGKKSGLEVAASKRLAKIGTAARPAARAVSAGDNDALLERTAHFGKFVEKNSRVFGWVILGALALAIGAAGLHYWHQRKAVEASTELAKAVAAQNGRIGEETADQDARYKDVRPLFKTEAARRDAALTQYREVQKRYPGTGAAILARLAEASLLLDKREGDAALAAYEEVRVSALGKVDVDVRARALEGAGFAHELKRNLDGALGAYKELENTDVRGFKELGLYHQARVLQAKGDVEKAKQLLKDVHDRVTKPGENHPLPYLERTSEDRLRAIDPTALPPKQSGPSQEDLQRMLQGAGMEGLGGGGGMPLQMPPPRRK